VCTHSWPKLISNRFLISLLRPLGVQAFLAAVQAAKQKGADSVVLIFEEPDVPRPRDNSEVPVGGSGGGHKDYHDQSNSTSNSGADASNENNDSSSGGSGGRPKPRRRASTLASGPVLDGDGDGGGGAAAAETVGASVFVGTGPGHWGTNEKAIEVIVAFLAALQLETYAPRFEVRVLCAKKQSSQHEYGLFL